VGLPDGAGNMETKEPSPAKEKDTAIQAPTRPPDAPKAKLAEPWAQIVPHSRTTDTEEMPVFPARTALSHASETATTPNRPATGIAWATGPSFPEGIFQDESRPREMLGKVNWAAPAQTHQLPPDLAAHTIREAASVFGGETILPPEEGGAFAQSIPAEFLEPGRARSALGNQVNGSGTDALATSAKVPASVVIDAVFAPATAPLATGEHSAPMSAVVESEVAPLPSFTGLPVSSLGPEHVFAPTRALPAVAIQALPALLVRLSSAPDSPATITLTLSPEELGRIFISMTPDGDQMRMTLSADRAETLDLLRRNADQLWSEMQDEGFSGGSLDFDWHGQDRAQPAPKEKAAATPDLDAPLAVGGHPQRRSHGLGALDIRI
jgi:hypothetical protein